MTIIPSCANLTKKKKEKYKTLIRLKKKKKRTVIFYVILQKALILRLRFLCHTVVSFFLSVFSVNFFSLSETVSTEIA